MTDAQKAYRIYLLSSEWSALRWQRIAMDQGRCVHCGKPAQDVHHKKYPKVRGEESVEDLVSLCGNCHDLEHGIDMPIRGGTSYREFRRSVMLVLSASHRSINRLASIFGRIEDKEFSKIIMEEIEQLAVEKDSYWKYILTQRPEPARQIGALLSQHWGSHE